MMITCTNCRNVYYIPEGGVIGCPVCKYVNEPKGGGGLESSFLKEKKDSDLHKTLYYPEEAQRKDLSLTDVSKVLAGRKRGLPSATEISLTVLSGTDKGKEFVLSAKTQVTIGRAEADVLIDDPEASRQHCALEIYDDVVVLIDIGSTNGTYVNEFLISASFLSDKDKVRVGGTILQFSVRPKR